MGKSYTNLLKQNWIQLNYLKSLFERRGESTDLALNVKVSDYLKESGMDETLIDLFFHAIQPLYRTSRILENPTLTWENENYSRISEEYQGNELVEIYEKILTNAEKWYEDIDPNNLIGELSEIIGKEDILITRLAVVCFHAVHHISQIIRLHGMLCEIISKKRLSDISC